MTKLNKIIFLTCGILLITGFALFLVGEKKENLITCEIIFNSNGGSLVEKQIIKKGQKVNKPNNPTKEGYIFKEWILDNKTFDFETKITKNITLNAKWEKVEETKETKTYIVTFNTEGGNEIPSQKIEEGNKINKPNNPIKEGYIFKEWTLDNKTFDFETKITKNITLNAKWEKVEETKETKTYVVTFNTEGGNEIPLQKIEEGNKINKPNNPTKEGYIFKEWTLDNKTFDFETKITKNITLNAKWEKIEETIITTTYGDINSDGVINARDKKLLFNHLSNASLLTGQSLKNADINADGSVNEVDNILMQSVIAGINSHNIYTPLTNYVLYGDINSDGVINARDKKLLFNHLSNSSLLTGQSLKNADINADGIINESDKTLMEKIIQGSISHNFYEPVTEK